MEDARKEVQEELDGLAKQFEDIMIQEQEVKARNGPLQSDYETLVRQEDAFDERRQEYAVRREYHNL